MTEGLTGEENLPTILPNEGTETEGACHCWGTEGLAEGYGERGILFGEIAFWFGMLTDAMPCLGVEGIVLTEGEIDG